jgi:ABC-type branched-subunit amino acid transport system substrate-binding protein
VLILAAAAGCPSATSQPRPNAPSQSTNHPAAAKLQQAQRAQEQGQDTEALALYEEAARAAPQSPQRAAALLARGQLAAHMGQLETARASLEQVATEYPGHPAARKARLLLGTLDLEAGRTQEGLAIMRNALGEETDPEQRRVAARDYGVAAARAGQHAAAIEALAQAENATLDPQEKAQLQALLVGLVDHGLRPTEALDLREHAQTGSFAHSILTLKLGRIYMHTGEETRARDELQAFLAQAPHSPFAAAGQAALRTLQERLLVSPRRLGVVLPMTGKYEQVGQRVLAALKLGLQQAVSDATPAKEAPAPLPVEMLVEDDKSNEEETGRAVERLLQDHKVMAVVGAVTLQGSKDAAIRAEALKVPLLTLARREGLAQMGPWTFQMALTDERQAREVARIAFVNLGFKRVALLYPRLPRGVALTNAFWDQFEAQGGAVAAVESYDHDETTFKVPIRKLVGRHYLEARGEYLACAAKTREIEQAYKRQKALEQCRDELAPVVDFDGVFVADWHGPVGLIAPALAVEDVFVGNDDRALRAFKQTTGRTAVKPIMLLGTNGFNDKNLPQRGGKYVQGAVFVDGFNPHDGRPETQAFLKAFAAAGGGRAELREAQAYDAGRILGAVFARNPQSRQEFQERLSAVADFPGVVGPATFDSNGTCLTPLHVFTIRGDLIVPYTLGRPSGG